MRRTSLLSVTLLIAVLVLLVALERRPVAFSVELEGLPAESATKGCAVEPGGSQRVLEIHRERPSDGIDREALRPMPGKGILIVHAYWKDDSSAAEGARLMVCLDPDPSHYPGPTTPGDRIPKRYFAIRIGAAGVSEAMNLDPSFVGIRLHSSFDPTGGLSFLAKGEVHAGEILELHVLVAPAAVVRGRVVDARGEPIPDALFHSTRSPFEAFQTMASNCDDGSFCLHFQEKHEWFFACAPGYAASKAFTAGNCRGEPLIVRLTAPGRDLHGRLCGPGGGAVVRVRVYAHDKGGGEESRYDFTDGEGRFTLIGLLLGSLRLTFLRHGPAKYGFTGQIVDVELGPEQPEFLQVVWEH